MLTVKGIGGGGSAKVTNGILQEMYAAEGEVSANTFVDFKRALLSDSNEYTITKTETLNHVPDFYENLGPDLLIAVQGKRTSSPYYYQLTSYALENGFYVQKNTLTAYSVTSGNGDFMGAPPVFIKIDDSHIAMIWVRAVNGETTISLKAKILIVDSTGNLSLADSVSSATTIATLTKQSNVYGSATDELSLKKLPDRSFVLVSNIHKSVGSVNFAFKFRIDSERNFIAEDQKVLKTFSKSVSMTTPQLVADDHLVFTTYGSSYDIELNVFRGSDLTHKTFSLNGMVGANWFCSSKNSVLVSVTNSDAKELKAYLYAFDISQFETNSPILQTTWTAITNWDPLNDTLEHFVELEKDLFLVSKNHDETGQYTTQFNLLSLKNGEEGFVKEFTETTPPITTRTVICSLFIRTADDGLLEGIQVGYASDVNEIYHFTLGKIENLLLPAATQIRGLTKSAATKEQKGQVWLLNTQEGEE